MSELSNYLIINKRIKRQRHEAALWLVIVFVLGAQGNLQAQFSSTINGYFPKAWEGKQAMIVANPLHHPKIIDTTTIVNRSATFTINLAEPCPAYLWVEGNKDDIQFFIDSPTISIGIESGLFGSPIITGSASSELWPEQLTHLRQDIDIESDNQSTLFDALRSGDSLKVFSLEYTRDSLRTIRKNAVAKLILEKPQLASSWYLFASDYFPYKQTLELFNGLTFFAGYPSYQEIKEQLARKQLGNKAPDFSLPGENQKIAHLSALPDHFVLIDFSMRILTACQKRHVDLKKLYKKYHASGLEIITVSVEFDQLDGQNAATNYRLPWIQVQDFMEKAVVTKDYAVHQMPDNVLLDANKIMIGRDMSIQELDMVLEQLMKK
ncbi:TlpA disulfide reductase family protein [Spirosoma pollinicola]|uniref:Thioredoxin domain-containing protein n=1 Tax=Spirosoma pollinicola TaxID=2057025 RepID=A0A2K8YWH2_9BACT|nr:TlpA disulfide reductase family protein [Spirosoma pollinicola]AUD01972.1 hypothetical protein CWM47_09165 [Spirosoma pollinicola]